MTGRAIEQLDIAIEGRDGYVRVRVGFARFAATGDRAARRRPDHGRGRVDASARRSSRARRSRRRWRSRVGIPTRPRRPGRRRQPVRLRGALDAVLRDAPPEPELADDFRAAVHDELEALITAAGGRTLALFTSWRSMDEAADALRGRVDVPDPHPARSAQAGAGQGVRRRRTRRACSPPPDCSRGSTCRAATLSLVVIDRIPFPRPDDPLLSARREQLGPTAFAEIDIPRASMMLAQACGRLIRYVDRHAAWWRSWTRASARPATAGTS